MIAIAARCMLLIALVASGANIASAQTTLRWQLSWFDTSTNTQEQRIFESREDAVRHQKTYERVQNLAKGGPLYTNWKLTSVSGNPSPPASSGSKPSDLLSRLRESKAAVAAAARTASADAIRAKELLLRQVIDEYKDVVSRSYEKIRNLEKTLTGGTQAIQEQRFREINTLVDEYNRQVNEFASVMGPTGGLGFKPLPRFQAPATEDAANADLQAQLQSKLGWATVSRTPPGFGSLKFDEDDVGAVIGYLREGGQRTGRWRATGPASIELTFPGIGTIRATLEGDRMTLSGCAAYPESRVLGKIRPRPGYVP